jgi:hypothetical protein
MHGDGEGGNGSHSHSEHIAMKLSNHAEGFRNQWGYAQWVDASDLSESFWQADTDEEGEVSPTADPVLILIAAEEAA